MNGMSFDALFFMIASWGAVIGLTVYCFYRVLTSDSKKK